MATVSTAKGESTSAWRRADAACWLRLAAAPIFALIGIIAALDPSPAASCAASSYMLPAYSMTTMYLLMSLFHLPTWFWFVRRSRRPRISPLTKGDRV